MMGLRQLVPRKLIPANLLGSNFLKKIFKKSLGQGIDWVWNLPQNGHWVSSWHKCIIRKYKALIVAWDAVIKGIVGLWLQSNCSLRNCFVGSTRAKIGLGMIPQAPVFLEKPSNVTFDVSVWGNDAGSEGCVCSLKIITWEFSDDNTEPAREIWPTSPQSCMCNTLISPCTCFLWCRGVPFKIPPGPHSQATYLALEVLLPSYISFTKKNNHPFSLCLVKPTIQGIKVGIMCTKCLISTTNSLFYISGSKNTIKVEVSAHIFGYL